jgi:vacuolar protein sorting-associated protein 13A/C
LSYEDIRFYRSIGRSQLRKERANQQRLRAEQAKNAPPQKQGWVSWALGYSAPTTSENEDTGSDGMTDKQRQELYAAIDYDESDEVTAGLVLSRDIMKARIYAQLRTGSLALRRGLAAGEDVISITFDDFNADIVQRPDNLDATLTLGGMHVHDGTTPGTLYPEIIRMKDSPNLISKPTSPRPENKKSGISTLSPDDPFFYVKFEHNPLDERADNAFTLKMKAMEIIYHHGYLEEIFAFFKPPESQLESVAALLVSHLRK